MRRDPQALAQGRFDVIVTGGGMHGAWITLRAAEAGLRVALLERSDFGAGTSANSLKILHGGLRYLQSLDLPRMRASIAARREFARVAPHLFTPLPCVMALGRLGLRSPWVMGPALLANDLLSADRNHGVAPASHLPRGTLMSGRETAGALAPLLEASPFAGAKWWDAVAADTARVMLEVLHRATALGAVVANRMRVEHFLVADGRVQGVAATDLVDGSRIEIASSAVVNAAGPWAGELQRASSLGADFLPVAWTGGLNVVLGRDLGNRNAVALPSPREKREFFFVPWRGRTMIGTGYFRVEDAARGCQGPPEGAVQQFVAEAAEAAPAARITLDDVALTHWGLLPLATADARLPARRPVLVSGAQQTGAAGLVVVVPEKLTSAPLLSRRVVQCLRREIGAARPRAREVLPMTQPAVAPATGLPDPVARLRQRHGARAAAVAALASDHPHLLEPVLPGAAALRVEVAWAMHEEMALTLSDIMLRRLGWGDAGDPGEVAVRACAEVAAGIGGWSAPRREAEIAATMSLFAALRRGEQLSPRA